MTTLPFVVGQTYQTKGGKSVTITEDNSDRIGPSYWCIRGDDDIWRYNRESDRGRVTGSAFDMSDPLNLVPLAAP